MNPNVSFFPSLRGKGKPVDVQKLLTQIKGGTWQAQIVQLRNEPDPGRAKSLKRSLPCFSGSCTTSGGHKSADVIAHSGLLQVDVDKIGMEAAERLRDALQGEPCAFAAWLSPSGNGLKILVRVPDDISRHAESFAVVEKHFLERWQVKIDPSCKDVSRLCFVSWDPKLWINADAVVIEAEREAVEPVTEGREYFLEKAPPPPPPNISTAPTSEHCTLLLPTTSTQQEGKRPKRESGLPQKLLVLYSKLCDRRLSNVEPGTRNDWLCELVPLWHHAIAESVAMQFAEAFWREHNDVFHDSLADHLKEAGALYRGLESSYLSGLSESRQAVFKTLEPDLAVAFRICLGLVGVDSEFPSDQFFISADQLGIRTGFVSMKAHRLLSALVAKSVLEVVTKGTRREAGKAGLATIYRFKLQ